MLTLAWVQQSHAFCSFVMDSGCLHKQFVSCLSLLLLLFSSFSFFFFSSLSSSPFLLLLLLLPPRPLTFLQIDLACNSTSTRASLLIHLFHASCRVPLRVLCFCACRPLLACARCLAVCGRYLKKLAALPTPPHSALLSCCSHQTVPRCERSSSEARHLHRRRYHPRCRATHRCHT